MNSKRARQGYSVRGMPRRGISARPDFFLAEDVYLEDTGCRIIVLVLCGVYYDKLRLRLVIF